jgi:creatinine amidohydrolase
VTEVWLSRMTSPEAAAVAAREHCVAVIVLGSTEQHGPHLPMDVDTRITSAICEAAARAVVDEVGVVLAPPLSVGISEHHMRFPGSLTLAPETFVAAACEIGSSLVRHGFDRLVLVNGHAGNAGAMQLIATRLRLEAGATAVVFLHEWMLAREAFASVRESGPGGAAHACEYETSVYLHLDAEVVQMTKAACELAPPSIDGTLVDLFLGGPYGAALGHDFSKSGILGDPTLASAEKGRRCFDAAVANLADLLRSVARAA